MTKQLSLLSLLAALSSAVLLLLSSSESANALAVKQHDLNKIHNKGVQSFGPKLNHARFHADALLEAPVTSLNLGDGDAARHPRTRRHRHSHSRAAQQFPLERAQELALTHAAARTGVPASNLRILSAHTSPTSGTTHVYLRQHVKGLDIANADASVAIDKQGAVVAFGEALFRGESAIQAHKEEPAVALRGEQYSFSLHAKQQRITPADGLMAVLRQAGIQVPAFVSLDDSSLHFTPTSSISPDADAPGHLGEFAPIRGVTRAATPVAAQFIQVPSPKGGSTELVPAYSYIVESASGDAWFEARACALTGKVLAIDSWVASLHANNKDAEQPGRSDSPAFRVYPIGCNDPDDKCKRQLVRAGAPARIPPGQDGAEEVADPGWLGSRRNRGSDSEGSNVAAETAGNNVVAELNPGGDDVDVEEWPPSAAVRRRRGKATDGAKTFDSPLNLQDDPAKYMDAAVAQLFYTVNALHDIMYRYGFTEAAGNFQLDNLGRLGAGNDPVVALAQDGSGYNNANFATPPDGKSGRMRMYVWNKSNPHRDGDLESGIVAHEFMHGVTTRLTGGRMNSGCLGWGEAGGMGEGWGDVLATLLRMRSPRMASRKHANKIGGWHMGKYANGGKAGIRKYPYASDMSINPSVYSTLNSPGYFGVHAKGEVWAIMLLEVFWDLVDVLGFSTEWRADFSANKHTAPRLDSAPSLFIQILMDALQIQPCRPSFTDARDAMLVAEKVLTGGKHQCTIWNAFARRGLGVDASSVPASTPWEDDTRVDGFKVPEECQ